MEEDRKMEKTIANKCSISFEMDIYEKRLKIITDQLASGYRWELERGKWPIEDNNHDVEVYSIKGPKIEEDIAKILLEDLVKYLQGEGIEFKLEENKRLTTEAYLVKGESLTPEDRKALNFTGLINADALYLDSKSNSNLDTFIKKSNEFVIKYLKNREKHFKYDCGYSSRCE